MNFISILKKQADLYASKLNKKINEAVYVSQLRKATGYVIKEFFSNAFKPISKGGQEDYFNKENLQEFIETVTVDVDVVNSELDGVSSLLSTNFNNMQDFKTASKNNINNLKAGLSELNSILGGDGNSIVFKDSFNTYNYVERNKSDANISTSEGIAHLKILNVEDISNSIKSIDVMGNGIKGNYGVVKSTLLDGTNMLSYISDEDAHDGPTNMTDGDPQTWFEYQVFNNFLDMKIELKFNSPRNINWIDIIPYIPQRTNSSFIVNSIKYINGSIAKSVFPDREEINTELRLSVGSSGINKFNEQGIFVFPEVYTDRLEFTFKQRNGYSELIGRTVYYEISENSKSEITDLSSIDDKIKEGPSGVYISGEKKIEKVILQDIDKIRFCIGLRGVDLYYKEFEVSSEMITQAFETEKNIKRVMLYCNEFIPDEFIRYGINNQNIWIQYYISVDDINWYPISPSHRNALGDGNIAPKIYEINSRIPKDAKDSILNTGYINTSGDVKKIRMKVVFNRPDEVKSMTPILEEYILKCEV